MRSMRIKWNFRDFLPLLSIYKFQAGKKKTFIALRLIDFMSSITKIIVFLKLSPKIMKASNYLY